MAALKYSMSTERQTNVNGNRTRWRHEYANSAYDVIRLALAAFHRKKLLSPALDRLNGVYYNRSWCRRCASVCHVNSTLSEDERHGNTLNISSGKLSLLSSPEYNLIALYSLWVQTVNNVCTGPDWDTHRRYNQCWERYRLHITLLKNIEYNRLHLITFQNV